MAQYNTKKKKRMVVCGVVRVFYYDSKIYNGERYAVAMILLIDPH
jgi:hypothetical protein